MRVLTRLFVLQTKAKFRNVFSKPASAIFASAMILLYGALIVMMLLNSDTPLSMVNAFDVHGTIMINIGYSALMVFTMLLQKRVSLLFENDAFYLFTGPFKRSQIMRYIMSSTLLSSVMMGALNVAMFLFLGMGLAYTAAFLLLAFFAQTFLFIFFLNLQYYFYLLSMDSPEKMRILRMFLFAILAFTAALFVIAVAQNDFQIAKGAVAFLQSDLFYLVPIFGWVKMVLVSYVSASYGMMMLGIALLAISGSVIFYLMSSYKGEFVEHAMQDAAEFTAMYKEIKAGKRSSFNDKKVKQANVKYRPGAGAIFSKNMLMMKKTRNFIRYTDLMGIGIYLVITLFGDLGFNFFLYMMIFWSWMTMMSNDYVSELKNYQIYLIPDKAWKKLLYLLFPSLLKLCIVVTIAMVLGLLLFQPDIAEFIQGYIMLIGYNCLFMSASILSLRILKSRTNQMLEGMMQMLIMVLAAAPGILVLIAMISSGIMDDRLLIVNGVINLAINFVISALILFACRHMLDGRELNAD